METKKKKELKEVEYLWEIMKMYDNIPRSYIQENLKIKNKAGELVPFIFNEAQEMVDREVQRQLDLGVPVRVIVLKARREGISTLSAGYGYEKISRHENMNGLVIAHEPDATSELFEMTKVFYDETPSNERPMKKYDNKTQLTFENPDELTKRFDPGLRSKIRIATANKVRIGRGINLHFFHGSEVSYWADADKLMLAVMQAVPALPNTMVIIESTANGLAGRGKYFYDKVIEASLGKSDFKLVFLPWFVMKEYTKPLNGEDLIPDEYERWLIDEFKLTKEQLNWRRWAIVNLCDNDVEKFKQEYPATIQEAFIASADSVIPKSLIEEQMKFKRKPIRITSDGVEIYEEAKAGHFYSMGGDSAEGEGGDDGSFSIIDAMTGREVAAYASDRCPPDELGRLMVKYGKIYNNAILVPELNHPGTTMIAEIKRLQYSNIFMREVIDRRTNAKTKRIGWRTTRISKLAMVSEFKKALRDEDIGLSSEETINQMFTFVKSPETEYGMGAEIGSKDDRLISAMLAWQGLHQLPIA